MRSAHDHTSPRPSPPLGWGEGEFYALTFATCSNQWLIGTQQVAWLYVTAITNQHSAFVPVALFDLLGVQPGGVVVSNLFAQAGRVVVVGEEPLLEASRTTNGLVQADLYAPPGATVRVEWASQLPTGPGGWNLLTQTNLTTLSTLLSPVPANTPMRFFRAVRQ